MVPRKVAQDTVIVVCVRTGTKYGFEYVTKLRNMLARWMPEPYAMVCLTDQPDRCEGVMFIDITAAKLPGWWAKMLVFEPTWRQRRPVIFLDLDIVIVGDLSPLTRVPHEFATCENFTRLAGFTHYPCRYNSSVMVLGGGMMGFIWKRFEEQRNYLLMKYAQHGDQAAIEELYPRAAYLQRILPKGFFLNYRHLTMQQPESTVLVTFGGSHKPDTCPIPWVKAAWG